jgi:serine/threonine protein phosphatase PrpC
VRALVEFANKEGGEDNITAVAFSITADGEAEAALDDTVTMRAVSDEEPDEETAEFLDDGPQDTPPPPRRPWWRAFR